MLNDFKKDLQDHLLGLVQETYPDLKVSEIRLETPANSAHGEYSWNFALTSAKQLRKPPIQIAEDFTAVINSSFSTLAISPVLAASTPEAKVAKPGFINFYLAPQALQQIPKQIFEQGEAYGRSNLGKKKR